MEYHYDKLNDSLIISLVQSHIERFNQAWLVVMNNPYKSGIYISAEIEMNNQYSIIGRLERYIYNSRPSTVYDSFKALNT